MPGTWARRGRCAAAATQAAIWAANLDQILARYSDQCWNSSRAVCMLVGGSHVVSEAMADGVWLNDATCLLVIQVSTSLPRHHVIL